jgi:TonB family protein
MIDPLAFGNFVAFSAQSAVIAAAALALPMLLRITSAQLRYSFWRAVLAFCLLLPWLQPWRSVPSPDIAQPLAGTTTTIEVIPPTSASLPFLDPVLLIVILVLAGALVRLLWLAVGYLKLRALRGAGESAADDEYRELQALLEAAADVRYVEAVAQPVTFGWRHPVVLLPAPLRDEPAPIREAVVAHELVHIRRGDWVWVVGEEVVRSVFWYHPALWWLVSRIQLAREELVDLTVVASTGRRRAYLAALVALANATRVGPAPAFAWRRHLFRRIMLISQEDAMSARRLILSAAAAVIAATVCAWYAMNAFPLSASDLPAPVQAAAGPLERAAQPVSSENPVPRRQTGDPIDVPRELSQASATATVLIKLTIDQSGNVAEARVTWLNLQTPDPSSSTQAVVDAVVVAALDGVRRWRFDPPAKAPIAFETQVTFGSGRYATYRWPAARSVPPPPPPPPPPPAVPAVGSAPPAPTPPPSAERATPRALAGIRVGQGGLPVPRKLLDVRPVYPPEALAARVQGIVILEIRIDEGGLVDDVQVLRSIPELDDAAIAAVRQWQFQPTLLNGVATPVVMAVTVQFTLAP